MRHGDTRSRTTGALPVADPTVWEILTVNRLAPHDIVALLRNDVGAVIVPGILSPDECDRLLSALPAVGKLGTTFTEHLGSPARRTRYFERVPDSEAELADICTSAQVHLRTRILDALKLAWPQRVAVAMDPDHGSYASGAFRMRGAADLHCDFATIDAPDWSIAAHVGQLACSVHLAVDHGSCGDTIVYRKPSSESLDQGRPGAYGQMVYADRAVEGAPSIVTRPRAGDLVMFNSVNLHRVLEAQRERIAYATYVGVTSGDRQLAVFA